MAQQNKDGFGSYDQWNFVYKNLEKQGYSKDLGERGDVVEDMEELEKLREMVVRETERADRAEEKNFRVCFRYLVQLFRMLLIFLFILDDQIKCCSKRHNTILTVTLSNAQTLPR